MRGVKKAHLPEKTCPACGRPFAWRKKWERDWDNVVYCSERCRCSRAGVAKATAAASETVAAGGRPPSSARRGRIHGSPP